MLWTDNWNKKKEKRKKKKKTLPLIEVTNASRSVIS